ncbi:MAG: AsmA-like C-terminal domain-containing protein [Candidatus Omnitrophota bacterium]|nr:AsmA-like C-terminal domain-containing protein [Candidatus Omnitrophota bacterium]
MKIKGVFITVFVILVILIAALAVFILTFDANRYKGALIEKLEASMDKDVRIDSISVNILAGFGVEAKGIAIKDRGKPWTDYLLEAKSLNASVEIFPLLKKDIRIQRLRIPGLIINTGSGTNFRCALDLKMSILINSMSQEDMLKTLSAKGNMKVDNAVLENVNVLNAALDKLNMLPDLVQKLKDNLPEKYSKLLDQNNTVFKPMDADFEIRDARIYFDKLLVESDAFYLAGKGSIGMDQALDIGAYLSIPQDLSEAFIKVVPELGYLTDKKGLITMPLQITGSAPNISIAPDLNYVIQRLLVSKGQELLDKLFKRK